MASASLLSLQTNRLSSDGPLSATLQLSGIQMFLFHMGRNFFVTF